MHLSKKTARYFLGILHHIIETNISFQMNLVSRLAAAFCASGYHIKCGIAKPSANEISQNNHRI